MPIPCAADTGIGSPSPRPWNSAASGASSPRSSLFAATIAGTEERPQQLGEVRVAGAQSGGGVDDQQHRGRVLEREARLVLHLARERLAVGQVHAARCRRA